MPQSIVQVPRFDEWGSVVGYDEIYVGVDDYAQQRQRMQPSIMPLPPVNGEPVHPMRPRCRYDLECDWLWFLAKFQLPDGSMHSFTICAESPAPFPRAQVLWFLENYTLVGFNNKNYDDLMLRAAMAGADVHELKRLNDLIIKGGLRSWHFNDQYGRQYPEIPCMDTIDLMEPAPGVRIGLKKYMGRMHSPTLQDLPFDPLTPMPVELRAVTDDYCGNDLRGTEQLEQTLAERIELRIATGAMYGIDLRSKSDAQMAEAIIKARLPFKPQKRFVAHGHKFFYEPAHWLEFQTPVMRAAFDTIKAAVFVSNDVDQLRSTEGEEIVGSDGKKIKTGVIMPPELKTMKIALGSSVYKLGIGGLHSTESKVAHIATMGLHSVSDHDVRSYYPSLILLLAMYPEQLGPVFLEIFREIYDSRLGAKDAIAGLEAQVKALQNAPTHERLALAKQLADAVTKAGGEKIVLNGTFGKLFSKYSVMFAPELGIRVTLTGQLSLLMLIEALEIHGVSVVSANTDGIVVRTPFGKEWIRDECIKWWERKTGLVMEANFYRAIYMRDVNNYVAVLMNGKIKGKGAYAASGVLNNVSPDRDVCIDAVIEYIKYRTPLMVTLRKCTDIRRFLSIRDAKGGGYDANGNFLGKTVRWYYATGVTTALHYKQKEDGSRGNKIAGSDGARACMVLPDSFPQDVDYDVYLRHAQDALENLGIPVDRSKLDDVP